MDLKTLMSMTVEWYFIMFFVFRRRAFYTAFKPVCFLFCSNQKVLMSILSLLCWRALEGFVLLQTFVTDFICSYIQELNKNYKNLDLIIVL